MRQPAAVSRVLAATASLVAAGLTAVAAASPAAAAPADGRIAFADFVTNQVYAINPDGSGLTQLTHEPQGIAASWPNWSPDGTHLIFTRLRLSDGVGRIWIMNADGTMQRRLATDTPGYRDYQPRYAPDGRHIVFSRCSPGDGLCAIWIMRSNGTHKRRVIPFGLAPHEFNNFDAVYSPDGHHLTFTRFDFRGIASQIWVAGLDGKHAHPLTAPRLEAGQLAWSPNGGHIAFASNSDRPQSGIYVMRANGTWVKRLAITKWPTNNFGPSYAPDGGQIAFSSDRRHPDLCCEDLFVMHADGTHQHLVNTGLQGVVDLAWGTAPLARGTTARGPSRRAAHAPRPGAAEAHKGQPLG
jgi:Tol biopolymer transport system component